MRRPRPAAGLLAGWRFLHYVTVRFLADRCMQIAASLTFTALLSLVPLLAVGLAMVSAFPIFQGMREQLQRFIFDSLVPQVGRTVEEYVNAFIGNTNQLTTFGIVGLAVTAVMLMATIEDAFNQIWHVEKQRGLTIRLLRFWTALTLGPILFASALALPRSALDLARATGVISGGPLADIAVLASPVIELVGFTLLYLLIPYRPVRIRHAMLGGLVASCLFELLKWGFTLYIRSFPTYETIYGALAAVPILLLWIYVAWLVVLFGAEITASLPAWRHVAGAPGLGTPSRRLILALEILAVLASAHRQGGGVANHRLHTMVPAAPAEVDDMLRRLTNAEYVAPSQDCWLLARDLHTASLYDLCRELGFGLDTDVIAKLGDREIGSRLHTVVARANRELTQVQLIELLAGPDEAALPPAKRSA